MRVDVELRAELPPALTIPADALIDSGVQRVVYVERHAGVFEPRSVETGWQLDGRVEIVRGLAAGERIALSGAFLIDADSRMNSSSAEPAPARDPVCGMDLRPPGDGTARWSSRFEGTEYRFCSERCKTSFDADPRRYARAASLAAATGSARR
jgi:YHS domain-containing protein